MLPHLPNELVLIVLDYLAPTDIKALRFVNKRISNLASTCFRRVLIHDTGRGRGRMRRALTILAPYLEQTRVIALHAHFPRVQNTSDQSLFHHLVSRPRALQYLSVSHHIDELHSLARVPLLELPYPALSFIRHLRLIGLRVSFDVLRAMGQLQDVTLDLSSHVLRAKLMYSEEEAVSVSRILSESTKSLKHFRMSISQLQIETLRTIASALPKLKTLSLIPAGGASFLPVPAVYPTEITSLLDEFSSVFALLPNLQTLSLPYFLGFAPPPGTPDLDPRTGHYLSPASPLTTIHTTPSFPLIDAASTLFRTNHQQLHRKRKRGLVNIGWLLPTRCMLDHVAVMGPVGLKVYWLEWARVEGGEGVEEDGWGWIQRDGAPFAEGDDVWGKV